MPFVDSLSILKEAAKNRYCIGAFNVNGLDQPSKLIKRAEMLRSPLLIVIPGVIEKYVDFDELAEVTAVAANKSFVPVGMHLSHGMDIDAVERAIKAGFTSVMCDGSTLPYEDNIKMTREAVNMGHKYNVAVEGELGALASSWTGENETMTNPQQAKDYVEKTGIDILAVAIGNAHGVYKGTPKIDFERLDQINAALAGIDILLTLHGGTGIPEDQVKQATKNGISKICIYTDMCILGKKNAVKYVNENPDYSGNFDIPELFNQVSTGFADAAEVCMKMFDSVNRVDNIRKYSYDKQTASPNQFQSSTAVKSSTVNKFDVGTKVFWNQGV